MKANRGKKSVVLFGAGASYGMEGRDPKPPLGNGLIDDLVNEFRTSWRTLDHSQQNLFRDDHFEDGMGWLMKEGGANGVAFTEYCKDMGIFFSRFKATDKSNLYCRLIDELTPQLLNGNIVLSTLNYECLIEHASQLILRQNIIGYRPGDGPIRLLKIHGSCNFGINPSNISNEGKVNIYGAGTMTGFPFRAYPINDAESYIRRGQFQPAMSVYVRGKNTHVGTDIVEEIRNEYVRSVVEAGVVAVIGVRPNNYDNHIWGPVRKTKARVVMINPDKEVEEWFNNNFSLKKDMFYRNNFNSGFAALMSEVQ